MKNPIAKTETKTGLFLKPSRLKNRWSPIEVLFVVRTERGIDYAKDQLSAEVIDSSFAYLTPDQKQVLIQLGDESLTQLINQLTKTHARQKAGTSLNAYIERSFLRQVHQLFIQLQSIELDTRWYHQAVNPATGNHLTAGCTLHKKQPIISFRVSRSDDGYLHLQSLVTIDNITSPLEHFKREYFFLQQDKDYFLLAYQDYQTLQWLAANDPSAYAGDAAGFSEHILNRLIADYQVEMDNIGDKQSIKVEPENAVYLSEISGSFLMLTPRWNYDGFWVEGKWQHTEEFNRNGEIYVVHRNAEKEKAFHDYLQSMHPNFSRQLNGIFNLPFAEAKKKHWFLKTYHKLLDENVELLGMEFLQQFRYSQFQAETSMRIVKTAGSEIHLELKVTFGTEEISLIELQKLLLASQKSLLLKDHSIAVLNDEWLMKYSTLIKHGRISKNEITVPQWIWLALGEGNNDTSGRSEGTVIPPEWWLRWMQWSQDGEVVYRVPATVKAALRPYQQKGFEWMCLLSEIDAGACLADDMGLGKTLQTICFLSWLKDSTVNKSGGAKFIIVCPASLLHNWRRELEKFTEGLIPFVYHSNTRSMESFYSSGADVLITSYGTLRSDLDKLGAVQWEAAILDESHTIKNPSAQITRAVYHLKAKARVALSGTPVMNNTFDLYSQLQFLVPGMFGSAEFFRKEYAHPIDREQNEEKINALRKLTAPFILRRTKQQVATDLPPKTEMVLWCEMGPEQKELYEETKSQIRDSLFLHIKNEGLNKSKLSILQGMQRLRQICAAPALLNEGSLRNTPSVKAEVLVDELQHNLRKNKVLVFSQFKGMLKMIGDACSRAGLKYYHFDGETPPAKRSELVEQFQDPANDVNIFLISLKAGNTGLTLTAADYVFLVDPWWNTAVQQQAIDRAYRIGQTKNVFAYQMICKDSIEEKIVELQQKKRQLSDALVTEDEGFLKQLNEDDLKYLFS
ncbi:DEAD/DEAH box helicase [Flavihumibacter solisilvae]|uniref:Helicase SNF2 n=1 Tax=Flavihumibacter solisilvae TaxID=1349421 RepID=A0A0C1J0L3_9BACT|nr:DEAD/DEAH box helicase [Flavihumibacter solisilvae]KIC96309.1 hypothetical protein OI18_00670 [Flavihumibacter solisilvae]